MKWDEMSPEEKDRLIAEKVMGWQAKECEGNLIEGDGYWECRTCGIEGDWEHFDDYMGHIQLPPRYTQNLDTAWQVLQKFSDEKKYYHFQTMFLRKLELYISNDWDEPGYDAHQ